MIFFPTIYEDELLYSAIARYHKRSGNANTQHTLIDLFSTANISASVFLPSNIDILIGNMPINCQYTSDFIIKKHTLLPFFTAFSNQDLSDYLVKLMTGDINGNTYAKMGIIASDLKLNKYFKFCPKCLNEDIEKYGEIYWHRSHQVPGMIVCHKHKVLLEDSTVKTRMFKHSYIVTAEKENCIVKKRINNYNNDEFEKLCELSNIINYILTTETNKNNSDWYQDNYINYLIKSNLATFNKVVNQKELVKSFKDYYNDKILNELNCNISYEKDNWIKRITRKGKYSDNTLQNILFLNFLKIPIEDIFNKRYVYSIFENGIAPCLNKGSNHYMNYTAHRSNTIYNCKRGTLTEEFSCTKCKFKYAIKGKNIDIRSLGSISNNNTDDQELLNLIDNHNLKVYYSENDYINKYVKHKDFDILLNKHRTIWIEAQKKYKHKSKSEISRMFIATYKWLHKHDLEWLNKNSPVLRTHTYEFKRVDWELRDNDTLDKLKLVVDKIYNDTNKPKRITLYRLSYETGLIYLNKKELKKMPKTSEYINTILESFDDIRIRKIKWAISEILKSNEENLTMTNVGIKAGINLTDTFWKQKIKEEINKVNLSMII